MSPYVEEHTRTSCQKEEAAAEGLVPDQELIQGAHALSVEGKTRRQNGQHQTNRSFKELTQNCSRKDAAAERSAPDRGLIQGAHALPVEGKTRRQNGQHLTENSSNESTHFL